MLGEEMKIMRKFWVDRQPGINSVGLADLHRSTPGSLRVSYQCCGVVETAKDHRRRFSIPSDTFSILQSQHTSDPLLGARSRSKEGIDLPHHVYTRSYRACI